jgi:hypothetical protein
MGRCSKSPRAARLQRYTTSVPKAGAPGRRTYSETAAPTESPKQYRQRRAPSDHYSQQAFLRKDGHKTDGRYGTAALTAFVKRVVECLAMDQEFQMLYVFVLVGMGIYRPWRRDGDGGQSCAGYRMALLSGPRRGMHVMTATRGS